MDPIETLVQDALTAHASSAPPASVLTVPRRRRWPYAALAAAVVVAVAVGLSFVPFGRQRHAPGSTGSPTTVAVPAGMRAIYYGGISILVPSGLTTRVNSPCGPQPNSVTVVDPPMESVGISCMPIAGSTGGPGTVVFLNRSDSDAGSEFVRSAGSATALRVTVDGVEREVTTYRAALEGMTASLKVDGVVVDVLARTTSALMRIFESVRVYTTDPLGCAALLDSSVPSQPTAAELVPGHPVAAHICDYATDGVYTGNGGDGHYRGPIWELGSRSLSTETATRLAAAIDALPRRADGVTLTYSPRWIVFTYADGSTRTILVDRPRSRSLVTDGRTVAVDRGFVVAHLLNGVR